MIEKILKVILYALILAAIAAIVTFAWGLKPQFAAVWLLLSLRILYWLVEYDFKPPSHS